MGGPAEAATCEHLLSRPSRLPGELCASADAAVRRATRARSAADRPDETETCTRPVVYVPPFRTEEGRQDRPSRVRPVGHNAEGDREGTGTRVRIRGEGTASVPVPAERWAPAAAVADEGLVRPVRAPTFPSYFGVAERGASETPAGGQLAGRADTAANPPAAVPDAPSSQPELIPGPSVRIPLSNSVPRGAVHVDAKSGAVSIVTRGAPLNEILEILADQLGLNMVTSEGITARVSATLKEVPFQQALTEILSVAGYTWIQQGNILVVTRISQAADLAPRTQGRQLRVFSLDYVSAVDVQTVIEGLLSPAGQSFVTQSASADNRKTQELVVVEDLPEYIQRIEQYVRQVDIPPRQVLIEAHVLSVELDDDVKHGINLTYLDDLGLPNVELRTQGFADVASYLKGTSPAVFFNLSGTDLALLLEALETSKDIKTLATPKILALNGQEARIQIGEQLGYRVTTTTQTSTLENVDFLDVGVVLRVTPWITKDNAVIMKVKPEISSGQINPDTELPEEETTEVETSLMLPDGYGMVIGGLIQEEDTEIQQKVPVVGDFWLVGRLFQHRAVTRNRTEIIITLIPHVVPYQPARQRAECRQFQRTCVPLTHGPLLQNFRSDEPRFPDAGQPANIFYKTRRVRPLWDPRRWAQQRSQERCFPGVQPGPLEWVEGTPPPQGVALPGGLQGPPPADRMLELPPEPPQAAPAPEGLQFQEGSLTPPSGPPRPSRPER